MLCAAFVVGAAFATLPAGAISIWLSPAQQTVAPSGTVDLTLRVSGLSTGAAPSLGLFDLNVNFDPAMLGFQSVAFGDPSLGNPLDAGAGSMEGTGGNPLAGILNLYSLSLDQASALDAYQADAFTLATLRFQVLGAGETLLSLSDVLLGDAVGAELASSIGAAARVGVAQSVPDGGMPSTGALVLAAGVVFGLVRPRSR